MKNLILLAFIINSLSIKSVYSQKKTDIISITITIDPNMKVNKYQEIVINDKDSIQKFMKKLSNRKSESIKFYPRFSLEIKYLNRIEKFLGNANHIKDRNGKTYILLEKDWDLFRY